MDRAIVNYYCLVGFFVVSTLPRRSILTQHSRPAPCSLHFAMYGEVAWPCDELSRLRAVLSPPFLPLHTHRCNVHNLQNHTYFAHSPHCRHSLYRPMWLHFIYRVQIILVYMHNICTSMWWLWWHCCCAHDWRVLRCLYLIWCASIISHTSMLHTLRREWHSPICSWRTLEPSTR